MMNLISSIPAEKVKAFSMDSADVSDKTLDKLGIHYTQRAMNEFKAYGMDALPGTITSASTTPVQFLQQFLPEVIRVVTQARVADRLLGRDIAGSWAQEELVAPVIEGIGQARPYGDKTDLTPAGYNVNYERRTIVRFEEDVEVGVLEEERQALAGINATAESRLASAEALAISMNDVAFNGYASGNGKTYGILNDANLPNYTTVAQGASSSTLWSSKTFNEICNDIKTAMSALRVRSGSHFDPYNDASVLGIADDAIDMLATVNVNGTTSVAEWIKQTYPKCRIESVPQFTDANSGASVFYLFAEEIAGRKVLHQYIQDTLRLVGVEKKAKGFLEAYSNATAGVLLSQPIGLVRYTGI